ncbi:alpha/beta fold hydrolase [Clostridium cibarium]|uniref:Alpha/beta hydrolase n=1 Tax=Clostridium cibarium TaxID=2762247 RepID=A0ABR8PS70_9CLOT|nr:alpha/beta hydrolase [Clostridium cibarium]MBD7911014.1 alpha/beta hydrolase [Clostridium cibarium]
MHDKINGIYYELIENSSTKENLVFVHGSGCNHNFLRPLSKKLNNCNCYLIDLPDHGKSDNMNCTKVEEYIDAVEKFVANIDNVTLIGHSLGGTICLGVAARSVHTIKKLVLISSGAKFDKFDQKVYDMVDNNKVNWIYICKCLGSFTNLNVLKTILTLEPSEVMLKDFNINVKVDITNVMSNINIPTLIMVGNDDILTIPEYSYVMKDGIKDSQLIIVPGVRHMLPIAKKSYVSQLIKEFMLKE